MKWPQLVKEKFCKTEIHVQIETEDLTEDGAPVVVMEATLKCNYQDGGKTIYTEDKKTVKISGRALFPGDICPELATISGGRVTIFGAERKILSGTKARNPDGTVNYTELMLE